MIKKIKIGDYDKENLPRFVEIYDKINELVSAVNKLKKTKPIQEKK